MKLRKLANNFHVVETSLYDLYFSYETLIGFTINQMGYTVKSKNIWSITTAKHLKNIPGTTIPNDEFNDDVKRFLTL